LAEKYLDSNPHVDIAFVINVHNADAAALPDEPALPVYAKPVESSEPEGIKDPNEAFRESMRLRDELLGKKKAKDEPDPYAGWTRLDWEVHLADTDETQYNEREADMAYKLSLHQPHDPFDWLI
jgi:hypothetical protein